MSRVAQDLGSGYERKGVYADTAIRSRTATDRLAVEHTDGARLSCRICCRLGELALRVQMRSVNRQPDGSHQKDARAEYHSKDGLPRLASSSMDARFQNVTTPSLVLLSVMLGRYVVSGL
jgi:hypothetical protein